MQLVSTSTQRTYRYLRLSIVGAVVLLFAALGLTIARFGAIDSISAAYYTPARDIFVGSVFAVALALMALSGRSVSQALLDYAAIVAPLIAIVPAPLEPGDVPADAPDIGVGVISLVIVAACGAVLAFVLALVQRMLSVALGVALAIAAAIVVAVAVWWVAQPESFLAWGHVVAAFTFFALIAAVAAIAAWSVHETSRADVASVFRLLYSIVAVGIIAALAMLLAVIALDTQGIDLVEQTGIPLVFIGEVVALVLFAAFWLIQTIELWDATNPSLRPRP
ncbi:MAG TPA: hypothetical protein VNT50_02360 [Microbacterium sp.]|uniref:hypothetical protein n=1 Tax=Microbacterium sp. TaxID=51671 RepID=UPI002CFF54F0|nr:hypothetical protein [Microbacterium sp.]HWI30310.1 hypothetical protein [Microbacterium sp.]